MSTEQKAKITKDHIGTTAWERQRVVKPGARAVYLSVAKALHLPTFFLSVNFSEEAGIKPKDYSISTLAKDLSCDIAERLGMAQWDDSVFPEVGGIRELVAQKSPKSLNGPVAVSLYAVFPSCGDGYAGVINVTYDLYPAGSGLQDRQFELSRILLRSDLYRIDIPDRYLSDPESFFSAKVYKTLHMKSLTSKGSDKPLPLKELLSLEDVNKDKARQAATRCLDELMTGTINVRDSFVALCKTMHEMDETAVVVAGDPDRNGFSVRAERRYVVVDDESTPAVRVTLTRTECGEYGPNTFSSHSKSVTENTYARTKVVSGVACAAYAHAVVTLFKDDMDKWDIVK